MRLYFFGVFTFLLISSCYSPSTVEDDVTTPNILWISVEDISPYLPQYGDSTITTPNIDRIAHGGTVYTNAFTCAGVCAPSRSAIITGMHQQSLGTMHMRTGRDYAGISTGIYREDVGLRDMTGTNVPEYSTVIPAEVKVFSEYLRKGGYFCSNNAKTDYQFAPPMTAWDECGMDGHWRNRQKGEPFFHVRSTFVTHESRIWAKKNDTLLVDPSTVPIPRHFPNHPIVRQDVARNYSNIKEVDIEIGALLDELESDGLMDNTIIVFWSDHGGPLPRGKREIYDTGLHVPLIIRVPSQWQDQVLGYEVAEPDIHFDKQMISMIDLAPSMMSIVGIEVPEYMQGRSFLGSQRAAKPRQYIYAGRDRLDTEYDKVRVVRDKDFLFVKNYYPELPNYMNVEYRTQMDMMQELLRLDSIGELSGPSTVWFNKTKTEEEFYVVAEDPLQLNNQINNPKYVAAINRLRKELSSWQADLNDQSVIPESQMVAKMWPDNVQPVTQTPEPVMVDGEMSIICATAGASIAYQFSDSEASSEDWDRWEVYDRAIEKPDNKYIHARAIRIGYKPSEVVTLEL